ncbi:MAG: sensor histidine kinase, partial [Nonlabens sp.]|nr:sensor histidine kinase [Nonlabens sp.]
VFYKSWWFIGLVLISTIAILSFIFYQYKMKQDLLAENKLALNEATIKTTMMLEIHHRIKNNLQIVSGLLGLQMADSDNEELKTKLKDSQHRIESIAGIHNLLYNANKDDSILVGDNVASIIAYYQQLLPITVSYQVDIDDSFLGIDKITPFSLLLNELINNSIKHAFTHTPHPVITIHFKKITTHYEFNYSDNGTFKKETAVSKTMGMRIIQMMTKQLKGTSTINKETNFMLKLQFPINE